MVCRIYECIAISRLFWGNWDAFDECLNDLEWISAQGYLLCISHIEKVLINKIDLLLYAFNDPFRIFINSLARAVQEWTKGRDYDSFPTNPIPFHILFHCENQYEESVLVRLSRSEITNINIINISNK
ncbi:barstar family protein [Bacillus toyonensis]